MLHTYKEIFNNIYKMNLEGIKPLYLFLNKIECLGTFRGI